MRALAVACLALAAVGVLGGGRLLPRGIANPGLGGPLLTGVGWQQLTPREKRLYVRGFLAGAAVVQAREVVSGVDSESSVLLGATVEKLRRSHALRFPFAPTVYAAQLDDYYWWTDRRSTPVLDAITTINAEIRHHGVRP